MRTVVKRSEHLTAVLDTLQANVTAFPVSDGLRPVYDSIDADLDGKHIPPPYAIVFFLSGGTMDGDLADSQADVEFRFQITAVGNTQTEAMVVQDVCAQFMQKELISVPSRRVRNVSKSLASEGAKRDDDVPTPIFYSFEVYLLDTTPA